MKTNEVIASLKSRIETEMPTSFHSVKAVAGSPIDQLLMTKKGIHCMISYRREKPSRVDAAGGVLMRRMVIGITLMMVHTGKTATEGQLSRLNDGMDTMIDVMTVPADPAVWWGADANICGVEVNEIFAVTSPTGDYTGRDMLFNVMVI